MISLNETDSKIHEIYEQYTNSREFNKILMHNDFDITWLQDELDFEKYRKLENYILSYCSRNDELLFKTGFKYAWALFQECAKKGSGENP